MHRYWIAGLTLILLCATAPATARDPMDPVATADAFSAALARGDEAAVKQMLAPDVLIYESGGQERSRDEYAADHMKGDMAYLAGMKIQVIDRKHGANGDLAWVATRSRVTGTYKDKPLDSYSTESLVLRHARDGWRIVHVQWSSRPVAPEKK